VAVAAIGAVGGDLPPGFQPSAGSWAAPACGITRSIRAAVRASIASTARAAAARSSIAAAFWAPGPASNASNTAASSAVLRPTSDAEAGAVGNRLSCILADNRPTGFRHT